MSWGDIAAIIVAIATVAGLNLAGLRWLFDRREKKQEAYTGRMDSIDAEFLSLSERVSSVEHKLQAGPDWDTINEHRDGLARIHSDIEKLSTKIDGLHEEQGHQRESIRRIEDHLLETK